MASRGDTFSYMTVDRHPVGVNLTARCALYFEGVVERLLFGVLGLEIGDAENVSEVVRPPWGRRSIPFHVGFEGEGEHVGGFGWIDWFEVKVLGIFICRR
jgi:hypothetical protein